jgi:hypothetical protein
VIYMQSDFAKGLPAERYVIEIDGVAQAEYPIFVKALKAGFQLKQEFPSSTVRLLDVAESSSAPSH